MNWLLHKYVVLFLCCAGCCSAEDWAELSGYENLSGVPDRGGMFFLNVKATGAWRIDFTGDGRYWCACSPSEGEGDGPVRLYVVANYDSIRTTQLVLKSSADTKECCITQGAHEEDLTNVMVGRLEIPRLTGDPGDLFIDHEVAYQDHVVPNYCMEYCLEKRHARWVALTAYDGTAENNVSRTEGWADDPWVPIGFRTGKEDYKGYDRGHLVASNDRRYCREANLQTFYYSNMSPQLADFNQRIWQKLEEQVKDWMSDAVLRDTLYVVKGGTIRDDQVIAYTGVHRVPVPEYYFMAVLARKRNIFKAIAFWLEHKVYAPPYDLKGKVISVDELEERTGIDFFPGLPDVIEDPVEAGYDVEEWGMRDD